MFVESMFSDDKMATANLLALAGTVSMGISYPILASGSKAKGRAEMLYMNPDPAKVAELNKMYQRKAKTNSIIAFSLLGDRYRTTHYSR
jgi:hypothetical protein